MENLTDISHNLLHPSLDIHGKLLVIGFRYRPSATKEGVCYLTSYADTLGISLHNENTLTLDGQEYFINLGHRKLAYLSERIDVSALNEFIKDSKDVLSKQKAAPRIIFERVQQTLKKYIELEEEIDYALVAVWAIGTYFFPIFNAYPFLHIKAVKGSGKSQLLSVLQRLCFNAIKARPTLPALSDTVDSLRGTYLIDQADALKGPNNADLVAILTDSYKRDGGKRRIQGERDKNGRWKTSELDAYSPKAFASIRELHDDLRDRCLLVPLIKSSRNFFTPDDINENWCALRLELYKLLFSEYHFVALIANHKQVVFRQKPNITSRELELWLPFEVFFELFGAENLMEAARKRFAAQYQFSEYQISIFDEEVVKTLKNMLEDKEVDVFSPKEIAEHVNVSFHDTLLDTQQHAAKIGWAIKNLNLASANVGRSKKGQRYRFERARIERIYERYIVQTVDEPTLPTPLPNEDSAVGDF